MSYKIKNGNVWVLFNGTWWLDTVLFALYPELRSRGLRPV